MGHFQRQELNLEFMPPDKNIDKKSQTNNVGGFHVVASEASIAFT